MLCGLSIAQAVRLRPTGPLRALEIGDKATDGRTLMDLYGQMASKPVAVDLPRLWEQLGVRLSGQEITLDDQAPLAAIRSSICGFDKSDD